VVDYATALTADKKQYASFFHQLLNSGIYLPPSPFESWFLSTEHSEAHIEKTLESIKQIMQ
ncbi:MAG: aspartate aminotransferase family protein, partial [Candidatus Sumerlaeia bacterium]|nr:aspartate aminotransferase family protein [Candidatus Sumerlaeia bacterium]